MTTIADTLIDVITAQAGQREVYLFFERDEANYTFPAVRFELQTGLRGISKDYALPEGEDCFSLFMPVLHSEMRLRQLHDYAAAIDMLDWVDADDIQKAMNSVQEQHRSHEETIEQAKASGQWDAREEELTLRGYAIEDKEISLEMLADVVKQVGAFAREDFDAVCQACTKEDEALLKGTYAELEALNPELNVLTSQIENREQMYDVLMGVLSKFNVADVKYYAIDGVDGSEADKDPAFSAREAEIEARSGVETNWIPAPSTQMRILQQLRQREAGMERA